MRDIFMSLTPSTINIQSDAPSTELPEAPAGGQVSFSTRKDYSAVIGWILRGGATLSAAIVLIGMLLLHPGDLSGTSLQVFPHTVDQVWTGLLALQPQAVITAGLMLLLATPVMTVTAAVVAFALERDRRYVVIALVVLAILITSFLIGKGG
jgi:uncharacterized membrane protein